jgi:hypothetical protein
LIAVVGLIALYQAPKQKSNLLTDFHASLCYEDSAFPGFQELYFFGGSDDSILQFKPAPLLPGFDRLVREGDADGWIETATALFDSACFKNIVNLEQECCNARDKWKRFAIAAQHPKSARVEELQLYVLFSAAAVKADIPPIDHVFRAQALIRTITLTIKIHGKPVAVRDLILERIAENHMGKGAVSRDLVFELYEHFYMSSGEHGSESHAPAGSNTNKPAGAKQQPIAHVLTITTGDIASTSTTPVEIKCRVCEIKFEETPADWAAKPSNDGRPMCMPKSCKSCRIEAIKRRRQDVVMLMRN